MNLDFNEWGVPLVVLVLGVLGGVALLSRQSSDAQTVEDDGRRRDLQRERAQALEALKHLLCYWWSRIMVLPTVWHARCP